MLANFFSSVLACTIIAVISRVYFLCTRRRRDFPVVNDYPGDLFRKRAYQDYNDNAKQLIANGFSRYNGPFAILVPGGMKIILPSSLSDWVKTNRNLDHHQLVREEYFAGYPGFEAQQAVHSSDRMMINLLRGKLSQNEAVLPIVNQHIATALYEHWGDSKSWHVIEWNEDTTGIISKAAACVFVGPEKACDPEWQVLIQAYVREYFAAVGELRSWPALLRPIVQWFLPHSTACRAIVPKVRAIMRSVVEKRRQKAEAAAEHGAEPPQYNDFVAWSCSAPTNTLEPGDLQLGLAMAALFTTSELLRQILIDIAQHSELITPLREEITQVLNSSGLGLAGLDSLELLDSVMKESQRLSSAIIGLERKVIRDTALPNGTKLSEGSHIMVDSSDQWSSEIYENPESFDGQRFLKRRQAGEPNALFVQSSREHNVFGGGRHICPGRFFAGQELKLCLVHVLSKYDIRMKDGYISKPHTFGVYTAVESFVQLEVRRRDMTEGLSSP